MSAGAELHRHTAMEITVCEHGAVKFDADGRAWTLLPGTVFVTQPGSVHRLRSNVRGSILRWIFVTCRIRKAMDILSKDPSARITDLATDLGFASSQHFAARFRRETGKTPSEYRAQRG